MRSRAPAVDVECFCIDIETARLRIEPLAARHAPLLFDGMCDPALYEWISMERPASVEALSERWARSLPRLRAATDCFWPAWAVQRKADGAWIGEIDADVKPDGVATNVGYFFLPAYWGRGHASEAVAAVCEHLAASGIVEQHAFVTDGNRASERVLERAGFVRLRVIPGNDTLRGMPCDDVEFVRRPGRGGWR